MSFAELKDNFSLVDDWEDRYRYVIELGRALPGLPDADKIDANKVRGCASQVWLVTKLTPRPGGKAPIMHIDGDSDAHIVRGLVAILLEIYQDRPADEIAAHDALQDFAELGLKDHLTPQRSNGLASMVSRIRAEAKEAAAQSATG
ncbi:MAG: cysteine desulfuration protein SufE [Hyphomicrobium sp.]|jgi:cysteine desulfuration protein SufE|nr:cysteine desulfuration protein SufE [Hyphomicrobium sp.]PPD06157.1 MAG: cysteine desulfuration protein SufE [Hyphomicrobium sp.]